MFESIRSALGLLVVLVPVACAVSAEDVGTSKPSPTPVTVGGSGQEELPAHEGEETKVDDPGAGGEAGAAGGNGDTGDEEEYEDPGPGTICGSETCYNGDSCCNGSYCFPANCTQCCSPPGAGGGGGGGGGSGGSSGGGGGPGSGGAPNAFPTCGGGACGSPLPQAGCYCDVYCVANLDCCPDFFLFCL